MFKWPIMRPHKPVSFSEDTREAIAEIIGATDGQEAIASLEKALSDFLAGRETPETPRADYLEKLKLIQAAAKKLAAVLNGLSVSGQNRGPNYDQLRAQVTDALLINLPPARKKSWSGPNWSTVEHAIDVAETFAQAAELAKAEFPEEESKPTSKLNEGTFAFSAAHLLRKNQIPVTSTISSRPGKGQFVKLIQICLMGIGYSDEEALGRAKRLAKEFIRVDPIERVVRGKFA